MDMPHTHRAAGMRSGETMGGGERRVGGAMGRGRFDARVKGRIELQGTRIDQQDTFVEASNRFIDLRTTGTRPKDKP